MERIGSIEGRSVWVRVVDLPAQAGGGQEILFECDRYDDRAWLPAGKGMMLAEVLGRERVAVGNNGRWVAVVVHDEEVDRLLVELIDVLVSIRYAHPTMVQLRLSLDVEDVPAVRR